jgi:CheY-like chemotaxis protein
MHTRTAGICVIQLCAPGEVWHLKTPDSSSQLLSLSCPLRRCDIEQTLHTLIAPQQRGPVTTLPANDVAQPQPLGLRILVAEDNNVNQVLIRQILTNLGCQIDLSGNGQEALDLFEKNGYDVILMDCQMPIMDGFQATQKIRAHELAATSLKPRTPIVALTAMTLETDVQLCLDVGMDDYLSKPLDKTLLKQKLRHWSKPTNECVP